MIPGVVKFGPEFGIELLADVGVLDHAHIPVIDSGLFEPNPSAAPSFSACRIRRIISNSETECIANESCPLPRGEGGPRPALSPAGTGRVRGQFFCTFLRGGDNNGDFRFPGWGAGPSTISAMLLDYFFHNAFRHTSKRPQSGSLLVHPTKELPALAIDEGDFAEVHHHRLLPRVVLYRAPASFQFAHPGAGKSSLQFQGGSIHGVINRNL